MPLRLAMLGMWHTHADGCEHHDDACVAPHMLHVWTAAGVAITDPFGDSFAKAVSSVERARLRREMVADR